MRHEDYSDFKYRPLFDLETFAVARFALRALGQRNLEGITYGLHELYFRRKVPELYEEFRTELVDEGIRPIPWLPSAYAAAQKIFKGSVGDCNLYVILLDEPKSESSYGLYVGLTNQLAEVRFAHHKYGNTASRHVRDRGIVLLPTLFDHIVNTTQHEAEGLGERLAEAFKEAGIVTRCAY